METAVQANANVVHSAGVGVGTLLTKLSVPVVLLGIAYAVTLTDQPKTFDVSAETVADSALDGDDAGSDEEGGLDQLDLSTPVGELAARVEGALPLRVEQQLTSGAEEESESL